MLKYFVMMSLSKLKFQALKLKEFPRIAKRGKHFIRTKYIKVMNQLARMKI